ncbi:DUF6152 family protein [Crenalkalicoccus roseus]|uniref:DUF6152 family protein n=1 Tax=Crenalkalicoccus roseus TaxID=1485588 RepID=UPI00107FDAFC|nr:DUF6152 family protein [Crenalkalicoccus roseus]
MSRRLALALPLLVLATGAAAHHGWGAYDADAPLTLAGRIERVEQGPHATLWLRAGDRTWEVVLAPPTRMANRGLPVSSLQPGQEVEVLGYVHRQREDELRAEWIRPAGAPRPVQLR